MLWLQIKPKEKKSEQNPGG